MIEIDPTASANAAPSGDVPNPERTSEARLDARLEGLTLRARRVLRDARHAIERRDTKAAAAFLDRVKAGAGDHPEYLHFAGVVLYLQHRYDRAVAVLRKALDGRPSDPIILTNLVAALRAAGHTEEAGQTELALTTLRRACEFVPELSTTWLDLVRTPDRDFHTVEATAADANEANRQGGDSSQHDARIGSAAIPAGCMDGQNEAPVAHYEGANDDSSTAGVHRPATTSSATTFPRSAESSSARNRLAGLSSLAADLLRSTAKHLRSRQLEQAEETLARAEVLARNHVEVRRTRGLLLSHQRRFADARELIEQLLLQRPDDTALINDLGGALFGCGDYERAFAAWRRACELDPEFVIGWFNLGRNLKEHAWTEEARHALERTVELAPEHVAARAMYAEVLVILGEFDKGRAQFLEVLRRAPTNGSAWWGLASIKTWPLSEDEISRLETLLGQPAPREMDAIAMGCSLAKAYEDHGRYAEAFATLTAANTRMRKLNPWSASRFSKIIEGVLSVFAQPHARASESQLGEELIFIVSLPRSGSTLTEQILAAHADVEGASELPDVGLVLRDESSRRAVEFPHWVAQASAEDWTRLGRDYLARTARWRHRRSRSTDKMPNNWFFLGAIRAMLPGARIVNCRRDPVETCWSCYKQMFTGSNEFSYDFGDLAAFWHDYDNAMRRWHVQAPGKIHDLVYEALLADPEAEVRVLLDFCDLAFDPACLRFHEAERSVRTASAAQVREPLRRDTARSSRYGALLDPLRQALASR